ncbi:MAG: glycosyl transferase family 2, partial [Kiritimatiellae bacterium]|nr:glycosyl transferase family 2 [Kiritimatiellia bacterium]
YWDGHVDTFKTDASWTCTRNRGQYGEKDAVVQEFGPFAMRPWGLRPRGKDLYVSYSALSYLVSYAGLLSDTELRPDFETDGDLRFIHRRLDGQDIYFVGNRLDTSQTATCRFRVGGVKSVEWWNPLNGERTALTDWECADGVVEAKLAFGPGESGFVVLGKGTLSAAKRQQAYNNKNVACGRVVEGPWKVLFDPAWGGPEGEIEFETLEDWTKRPEWGIQHYSGIATYRKTVTSKEVPTHIGLGDVANLARVKLNGKDLGSVWCWPWRVEVPKGVWKDGENLLEIEVANLWLNRLIGDASLPPEKRLTRTTVNPYKPTETLRRSGLFGPVRLEREQ